MAFRVRTGTREDLESIIPWTTDTFSWGDYIPERLPGWLEDPGSEVLVCVDESDTPVALTHALMLSPTEGWLEAARVHPGHRRTGLGKALNHAGVGWARDRGAHVVRLATESDNEAAISQVLALGYRKTSTWLFAKWSPDEARSQPEGPRLSPATGQDADAAWVFWSTSDLARAARGLIAQNWRWHKARPEDLLDAAGSGTLFQSPSGWVIVTPVEHDNAYLRADWAATAQKDAPELLRSLVDHAARQGSGLYVRLPSLPWVREAIARSGPAPKEIFVFAKAV